jgi:DNA-binding HxlR family transcriptional regulator
MPWWDATETGNENGNDFNRLKLVVQLDAKDTKGRPFNVDKAYNLLPNGRGLNAFMKDYQSWAGSELTEEAMYEFDGDTMMKGKAVMVEIDHTEKGKEMIPVIKSFNPVTAAESNAA